MTGVRVPGGTRVDLTWEQKLAACQAIGDCSVRMRKPGDWYVAHSGVNIATPAGMLEGRYGNGRTPEAAVEDHWRALTMLDRGECVSSDGAVGRRYFQWTGYMWRDCERPTV